MESGDISMNCLSQKCLSHCRKKNKIGQENLVGGRSDTAQFFMVSLAAVKEGDKRSERQVGKSRALPASDGRVVSGTYLHMNQCDMTESPLNEICD